MQTEHCGAGHAASTVYKESGAKGFFRGIASPLLSLSILNTLNFSTYNAFRRSLGLETHEQYDYRVFIAGGGVGLVCSLISTPFELVKLQTQLMSSANAGSKPSTTIQTVNHIMRTYGVKHLYTGYGVNTVREVVFLSVYFTVYEYLKHDVSIIPIPNIWAKIPIAGGIAGSAGWFISFPLDAVKVRINFVFLLYL
jgi:solute carrier family 25 carnitine/acylcarnitine transporter 20/29